MHRLPRGLGQGVALSFYYGASLPDPDHILLGSGSQNRFVRLASAQTLARPPVEGAIAAAIAQAKTPLQKTGGGYTLIKSVSAKQRPRSLPSAASGKERPATDLASARRSKRKKI